MNISLLIFIVAITLLAAVATQRWFSLRRQLRDERLHAQTSRNEMEASVQGRAVAGERERIYNDLHDDLGASLLHLVYTAPNAEHADAVRAVLQNLRDVVTRSRGTPGTLRDVLGDIRSEVEQRLLAMGLDLDWITAEAQSDPRLDNHTALHLHRIVREAITNVLRHANAQRVRIRVSGSRIRLVIEITDDGNGLNRASGPGVGTRSMRERAGEMAASINWDTGTEGGTKVLLTVPLPDIKE